MERISFIQPVLPPPNELTEDYIEITKNNFYTNSGPFEKKFESKCSEYVGQDVSSSIVANATLGLMLAISALIPRSSKKKEVLIQSFTFAAGAEAIIWCGLKPVFIDIEENTWQANLNQARQYIENNLSSVAGLLFCNTFGVGSKNISDWEDLANEYSIPLIIDSAAGFGSAYNMKEKLGAKGDCEIFSLHATKPFAIGEGGLVTSKNKRLIDLINHNKNFGFNNERKVTSLGLNAKASEISSAIGLRQLSSYDLKLDKRRNILKQFKNTIKDNKVIFQENDDLSTIPFISIKLQDLSKQDIMNSFSINNIDIRDYYNPPIHKQLFFENEKKLDLTVTEDLCTKVISLPLHDDFTSVEIKRLANVLV